MAGPGGAAAKGSAAAEGWLVLLLCCAGPVAGQPLERALVVEVARVTRSIPSVGVHVAEVPTGRPVFSHRADDLFILASNTKLATTAAALDRLGPGYFLETPILARGRIQAGVLDGDLAVVGGGDPTISGRHPLGDPFALFRHWARLLRETGVRRVAGDLFLDHGLFSGPWHHPDWDPVQNEKWYQPPVAALDFYENVVRIRALPGTHHGGPARVELSPPVELPVHNRVLTLPSRRGQRLRVSVPGGGEVVAEGGVFRGDPYLEAYAAVQDPVAYFGAALRSAFALEGLTIAGETRPVPRLPGWTWRMVDVYRSDLLSAIEVTNRESQNLFAESLLLLLGRERCRGGNWPSGVAAVQEFLDEVGIPRDRYQLADGSGLSRNNRMTPRQLTTLLAHMARHPHGREYIRSLPHGGQAGTSLERRLAEPAYGDNVFAKTGTLTGVSTLSGYAKGRSGRLYAFSILCNHGAVWRSRKLQDELVRSLIDNG